MAKTNIYDDKKLRYVDLNHPTEATAKWLYFFKTNVDMTEVGADLGQTEVTAIPTVTVPCIAGTRRPTPLIMANQRKKIRSLCSSSKFASAQVAGWRRIENPTFSVKRSQTVPPVAGVSGAILVTVDCDSLGGVISYGWFMQNQQFLKISDVERTSLGITIPTSDTEWASVVLGTNRISPPRARRVLQSGNATVIGGSDTTETFYKTGNTLPAGWTHSANAIEFSI